MAAKVYMCLALVAILKAAMHLGRLMLAMCVKVNLPACFALACLMVLGGVLSLGAILSTMDRHTTGLISANFAKGRHGHKLRSKYPWKHLDNFSSNSAKETADSRYDYLDLIIHSPSCPPKVLLLLLVTSSPKNVDRRKAIRQTWCSNHTQSPQVRCAFLLGRSSNDLYNEKVDTEIRRYGDVLKANYLDSYRNLTYKVLTGLHWSARHCPAAFVLKTDDDCFVNVAIMTQLLNLQPRRTKLYIGNLYAHDTDTEVIRKESSKWAVSKDDFAPDYYPPYASGSGYLLSQDAVEGLVALSRHQKPFPNEDAYIGVLVEKMKIKPINSRRFSLINTRWQVCNYLYLLVVHGVKNDQQLDVQQMANMAPVKCSDQSIPIEWE